MNAQDTARHPSRHPALIASFWLYVGVPLVWGVSATMQKAMALFA